MSNADTHTTTASEIAPDHVLDMVRFHAEVYEHNRDECAATECDHCTWDRFDSMQLLVYFVGLLDEWMATGGYPPLDWEHPDPQVRPLDSTVLYRG